MSAMAMIGSTTPALSIASNARCMVDTSPPL
jgi:hypothetical protein